MDFKNCNSEIKKYIRSLNTISYNSAEAVYKVTAQKEQYFFLCSMTFSPYFFSFLSFKKPQKHEDSR